MKKMGGAPRNPSGERSQSASLRTIERQAARIVGAELERISANTNPVGTQRSETRWRGASRQLRSLSNWLPTVGSGKSDLPREERRRLAARGKDAYRNHPIARAIITRRRSSIIGTGLICHPAVDSTVLGITEKQAQDLNEQIEPRWRLWAENPAECDVEATLDFYCQQALVEVSASTSGDCFALTPYIETPGGIYGLKVQLIDGERVSNPANAADTETLTDGIGMDAVGRPHTYWIRRRHPDDRTVRTPDAWDPYPVFGAQTGRRRALHIWEDKDQIGQVRGVSALAPILEPLQQITTLSRAELTASVVSALISVFIKRDKTQAVGAGNPAAFAGVQEAPDGKTSSLSLGAGAIIDLGFGEEPVSFNPQRPNAKFEAFWLACITEIGAAVELPTDELLLRYNSSYSAARAAMLQAWRMYLIRRWQRIQQFCQPIYALWFDEEVARGNIKATGYSDPLRRAAYTRATWTGPARGSMDEEAEANAAAKRIETGVSNETIECAAMTGEEWSTVFAQRQREVTRRRELTAGTAEEYGVAVRAGAITPSLADEEAFRGRMGLAPASDDVRKAWEKDGGARRPITLQGEGGNTAPGQFGNGQNAPDEAPPPPKKDEAPPRRRRDEPPNKPKQGDDES